MTGFGGKVSFRLATMSSVSTSESNGLLNSQETEIFYLCGMQLFATIFRRKPRIERNC